MPLGGALHPAYRDLSEPISECDPPLECQHVQRGEVNRVKPLLMDDYESNFESGHGHDENLKYPLGVF
jgi:hypothetical protein